MKVDFAAPIKDFDGKPIIEQLSAHAKEDIAKLSKETRSEIGDRLDDKKVTLGTLTLSIVRAVFRDEGDLPEAAKTTRFQLGLKAATGGEHDLSNEEFAELRKMLVRGYDALIAMRAAEILDAAKVKAEKKTAKAA
jgi:hypothetical protein